MSASVFGLSLFGSGYLVVLTHALGTFILVVPFWSHIVQDCKCSWYVLQRCCTEEEYVLQRWSRGVAVLFFQLCSSDVPDKPSFGLIWKTAFSLTADARWNQHLLNPKLYPLEFQLPPNCSPQYKGSHSLWDLGYLKCLTMDQLLIVQHLSAPRACGRRLKDNAEQSIMCSALMLSNRCTRCIFSNFAVMRCETNCHVGLNDSSCSILNTLQIQVALFHHTDRGAMGTMSERLPMCCGIIAVEKWLTSTPCRWGRQKLDVDAS